MERLRFYLRITGPAELIPNGVMYEEHIITQDDIDDNREDDESDEEVIDYFIEEEMAAWEQRLCSAYTITKEEYLQLNEFRL